jgi:hypothetical protein
MTATKPRIICCLSIVARFGVIEAKKIGTTLTGA